jgi:hypothetical protein
MVALKETLSSDGSFYPSQYVLTFRLVDYRYVKVLHLPETMLFYFPNGGEISQPAG